MLSGNFLRSCCFELQIIMYFYLLSLPTMSLVTLPSLSQESGPTKVHGFIHVVVQDVSTHLYYVFCRDLWRNVSDVNRAGKMERSGRSSVIFRRLQCECVHVCVCACACVCVCVCVCACVCVCVCVCVCNVVHVCAHGNTGHGPEGEHRRVYKHKHTQIKPFMDN